MADKVINNIKLPNGEIYRIGGTGGGSMPMFAPIWSDHLYNDISYLRADTFSWHSGSIYVTGYNTLLNEYNDEKCVVEIENGITYKRTPSGFKIADLDQQDNIIDAYEANGVAWYYIIDVENSRFKLPREKAEIHTIYPSTIDVTVSDLDIYGNGMTLGLTNGTENFGPFVGTTSGAYIPYLNNDIYGTNLGTSTDSDTSGTTVSKSVGITTDPENSGITGDGTGTADLTGINTERVNTEGKKYLYFYVGNYERPETEVAVGEISEGLNNKVDLDGENYKGSELEKYIQNNTTGSLEIGDIGIAPLGIDETEGKRRYLNGQIIIQEQYTVFTEKLKSAVALYPTLGCTEDEWQTAITMSAVGQCGKFVIDDENGTIRLPKIIMPIQGLTDLSTLAEIIEAGLPNITGGGIFVYTAQKYGATKGVGSINIGGLAENEGGLWHEGIGTGSFNASDSNPIYGKSTTVQPEAIRYPYFIQVATGSSTIGNITNTIELNNPYSLLDVRWSDKLLNNISWLRSEGQPNARSDYNDVYELLLREYNSASDTTETINDISIIFRRGAETNIKVTTDKTAYDSILASTGTAWYYVIDIENETFYLPQTNGFFQFGGTGEFVEAGLPNIEGTMGGTVTLGSNQSGALYKSSSSTGTYGSLSATSGFTSQYSFNASRSNPIYGKSDTVQPNAVKGYLYFYVGETTQNANLINAGRMGEKIVDLLAKPHIVETYQNGASWYRVYSDGWCEQGGYASMNATSITFLKPFVDTNYTLTGSIDQNVSSAPYWSDFGFNRTATGFSLRMGLFSWQASGYIA